MEPAEALGCFRERYRYTRWWAPALVEPVAVVSFVMSRRTLGGIRERAERESAP
jgi:HAMP domain-containing protein